MLEFKKSRGKLDEEKALQKDHLEAKDVLIFSIWDSGYRLHGLPLELVVSRRYIPECKILFDRQATANSFPVMALSGLSRPFLKVEQRQVSK